MSKNPIFREELPGEKKSLINVLMTGYIVTLSCLGYMAFYLYIQLGQVDRIVTAINVETLETAQVELLKSRVTKSTRQLQNEMIGLAIIGSVISIIGGIYTYNMVIRPLRKMVDYANNRGTTELPEFKSNTELKQLAEALNEWTTTLKTPEQEGNHNGSGVTQTPPTLPTRGDPS